MSSKSANIRSQHLQSMGKIIRVTLSLSHYMNFYINLHVVACEKQDYKYVTYSSGVPKPYRPSLF